MLNVISGTPATTPTPTTTATTHSTDEPETDSSGSGEDDSDPSRSSSGISYKERRREAHTAAEQKRRDAIKKGYEDLQHLVPTCVVQDAVSSYKLSKATILQRSIDYIQFLESQKGKQDDDLTQLRKEMLALQIMKQNYEEMVKHANNNNPASGSASSSLSSSGSLQNGTRQEGSVQLTDQVKFEVFKALCDALFITFDGSVSAANFGSLSGTVFAWLEENCTPNSMRDRVLAILAQLKQQIPQ